ncbi:hypothetical protein IAQ61_008672 [Plenodomus lingam]|uniref:Predicted protein n=1 Tax=Leptosphaeria maculans (strain JN3 / isolate v23.1.3 / race Av1-4-5-6-7-8) TaxID=985895 RepID=E4ZN76_LEPMJ|nr:predicted protein [Plenodomus lingam JN3]KAH9864728.1 hypothetical protein IAQ61_008672 [Plenodomus lingam]CBX92935.1 predicted protein [Plenodomus lingam JN3]
MPGRRQQTHIYLREDMDRVKGVPLPPKIKCGRCQSHLVPARFSSKQLTDARYQILKQGRITQLVNCMKCTGQQIVELECTSCGRTKGLEEFAKSQRNKPDTAVCFKCTELAVNDHAIDDGRYEDQDRAFLPANDSRGNVPEYWSSQQSTTDAIPAAGDEWGSTSADTEDITDKDSGGSGIALSRQLQATHLTGSVNESLIGSEYDHPATRANDRFTQVRSNKSWHTASAGPPSSGSGFNKDTYRKPPYSTVSASARTFSSSVAERSSPEIRSNGWAKIRSARNPPPMLGGPMRPMGDAEREGETLTNNWSDSDEDDNDDEDDGDSDDDTVI